MTLPFRRRHHDADTAHDRARGLASERLVGPISDADAGWLDGHLEACLECRAEVDAFAADRDLLQALRETPPSPPRDLWARTAAAIEREAGRAGARGGRAARRPSGLDRPRHFGRAPLGALSGALVVLVVVGASILSRPGVPILVPTPTSPAVSFSPDATPIAVTTNGLNWIRTRPDGTYELAIAAVDRVCPSGDTGCAPLTDEVVTTISLAREPAAVVLSPSSDQLVVVTNESVGSTVLVVPVATPQPSGGPSGEPSAPPASALPPSATPPTQPPPTQPPPTPTGQPASPEPSPSAEASRSAEPSVSLEPTATPAPTPAGATAIATGVILVGQAAYSGDGRWFAFAARPADGSAGPDIFVWRVGDPLAVRVTADGRSVFSGWVGGYVLGSRVDEEIAPQPQEGPGATGGPTPEPTVEPTAVVSAEPTESASSAPSPDLDAHLGSIFVIDPATGIVTGLDGPAAWRPDVDPTGRHVVYWDGTVLGDGAGGWRLGAGHLVLDGWTALPEPTPSPSFDPDATPRPSAEPTPSPTDVPSPTPTVAGSSSPDESASPEISPPPPGAAGTPTVLLEATGPIVDFDVAFDPTGTRLAVWMADAADPSIGRLSVFVIDPETGAIDADLTPLSGVPALRGFSIGENRLAWVTPPGQDGEDSRVSVLAWSGDVFGLAESNPARQVQIVR